MKPLKVALLHRDQPHRWARTDGQFAYAVPEFTWDHITVDKTFWMNLSDLRGYDTVWWDDGKHKGGPSFFAPHPNEARPMPVAFYCIYPTLNDSIYQSRKQRAKANADLVLLDHDRLDRWDGLGIPARRCAYSVNELVYKGGDGERDIDVGFFCVWNYNPERRALNDWLAGYCQRRGWRYGTNDGQGTPDYPQLLARSKVIVHLNRTPQTRPPRIFDASACGTAVLASRMPDVSGEQWVDGGTYVAFDNPVGQYGPQEFGTVPAYTDNNCAELEAGLCYLLDYGNWEPMAHRAQEYVLAHHTWRVRARELRQTLAEALKL